MVDSLQLHEMQHSRLPRLSPTPGAYSNSHPYMTTGKTIALTRWTFVDKVMSLLLNTLEKTLMRGGIGGRRRRRWEDEMAGWYHRLDGHGFGWTLGVGDGQGGPVCCDSWGRKESDTTEWLNWTELGRSPGEGKSYPLQYSGLENSMDCIVYGVERVRHNWATFTFTLHIS